MRTDRHPDRPDYCAALSRSALISSIENQSPESPLFEGESSHELSEDGMEPLTPSLQEEDETGREHEYGSLAAEENEDEDGQIGDEEDPDEEWNLDGDDEDFWGASDDWDTDLDVDEDTDIDIDIDPDDYSDLDDW